MHLNKTVLFLYMVFWGAISNSQTRIYPADSMQGDGSAFRKVDVEAFYPGGDQAWRKFLENNLDASAPSDNGAPVGVYTVVVQFVVDTNGNTSDVKALTQLGYGMEQAVIQLIKKAGLWSPAKVNKRPVKSYRKQPATFVVTQEGFDIISTVPYVLFTGIDNELDIKVEKMKSENLKLTISQGSIAMTSDGKFIIKVSKPGRALMEVYTKKNKKIADVSFLVSVPDIK
jgi:Gram-negative bacterial TonB protein C-terminal/GldM C-terminal domain